MVTSPTLPTLPSLGPLAELRAQARTKPSPCVTNREFSRDRPGTLVESQMCNPTLALAPDDLYAPPQPS